MNKDKIEVLNTIAANNGHKDWLELTHCEGPITIMNCTIEAMELYAQTAQLQQHGVSGKQPDYKTIHAAAVEYAQKEWAHANDVDTEKKYSSNDFHAGAQWALSQVACAATKGGQSG
jgi:hypothetical protein